MPRASETGRVESPGLWIGWHRLLAGLKIAAGAALLLLALVAAAETARIYSLARGLHPLLGYAAVVLILAAAALVAWPAWRFLRVPRVVDPPPVPEPEGLRTRHVLAEIRYIDRYLASCARNPRLLSQAAAITRARGELGELERQCRQGGGADARALDRDLRAWVQRTVPPLLAEVDDEADRLIYQEAVTVGVGTAVSPNGTLDAFVMLWRSVQLAGRIAELYYGRPGLLGTLAVCRDVALATAVAGTLHNVTDSLGTLVAKAAGSLTSAVAGPVVEGVTNALVLIRIGYLTKERCRSFRDWDRNTRRSALLRALESTHKVAAGLTAEICRQLGSGIGSIASAAVAFGQKVGERIGEAIGSVLRGGKAPGGSPSEA